MYPAAGKVFAAVPSWTHPHGLPWYFRTSRE
ncbi:hypothetical protein E2C01_090508 [Portunus trituberculatus]|uniref:Uncharacterized protein n=1 Tax=Portunus trituberculatus TaxID=210409 RepID=A0A5B7JSL7_PORTR|nr:hypothetical protein [Portunus trituberculatus]